jgi:hypothetical protein
LIDYFFIQKPKTDVKAVKTQVGYVKLAGHQLVLPKSTMWARTNSMPLAAPIRCHLSFARQRQGCLSINRQCIIAIYITPKKRNKRARRESEGK